MQHESESWALADQMRAGCLGVRIGRLHRLVTHHFEQALGPVGLSLPQLELLSALTLMDGPVRPVELADVLGVDRSTMSRNLSVMQTNGWIRRTQESPTGRSLSVTLTQAGHQKLASARTAWSTAQHNVRDLLGEDSVAVLDGWLTGLTPSESRPSRSRGGNKPRRVDTASR